MNKIHRYFIISIVLAMFVFNGCVDEVDIHSDFNETPKLVLYARLCPQIDSTYILLSNTQLLYSNNNSGSIANISDGNVELSSDGVNWIKARYDNMKGRFLITQAELPIVEGGTYYIRASYNGYEDVNAVCTVPRSHDVDFRIDTVEAVNDIHWGEVYNWPHRDVFVQWHDVPGEANAYGIKQYTQNQTQTDYPDGVVTSYHWAYNTVWLSDQSTDYQYVSDENKDGGLFRFMIDEDIYENDDEWYEDHSKPFKYYLLFLDRACYQYEKSMENNEFDLGFLMLEPNHTFTNIENGFGLFGAFSMREVYSFKWE